MRDDILRERLRKRDAFIGAGYLAYPAETARTHTIAEALGQFSALARSKKKIAVAGRVIGLRAQGGVSFADLADASGKLQVVFRGGATKDYELFRDNVDIGDFLEARGALFATARGEKSIDAKTLRLLAKSVRPVPGRWYGLRDTETRLRKRYLDLLAHPELRALFVKKAKFWAAFRSHLADAGFLEVETPVLERVPGGADAEPFVTRLNALRQDVFLRISPELPLKKLLVAGFEKVFEIGRIFRNEGIDAEHLQDYTQLEYYWAYQDYEGGMKFVEDMYKKVIRATAGSLVTTRGATAIDWSKKWPRLEYFALFQKETGLDMAHASDAELRAYAARQGLDPTKHPGRGRVIDLLFKKIRRRLVQPCFLVNPPVEIEPLAKRIPEEPAKVARFQVVAAGTELGKGFSELNDPADQRARFEEQMKLRDAGDKEAQRLDEDYLEAMEYGMPPCHGFGVSERLFAVLMDKPVRETVIFPLMRPRE